MATLTYTQVSYFGVSPTLAAASVGGDEIAVHASGCVIVHNADATATTVTVVVPGSKYGQARPDYTVSVAAGATAYIGPFVGDLADPITRRVGLTYSKVTSLTVGAILL